MSAVNTVNNVDKTIETYANDNVSNTVVLTTTTTAFLKP